MTLNDLLPAIARITGHPAIHDLRSITYLSTYPSIRMLGACPGPINLDQFHQIAAMAYGWMPRIVRIDPLHTQSALKALNAAKTATALTLHAIPITDLAACLHSLVGASKVLHFVNDSVFPIWDSNIETFRLNGASPPYNHMHTIGSYLAYAQDVHVISRDPGFHAFLQGFTSVFNSRLNALRIAPYQISPVRAIEAAAFELAP